MRKSKMTAEKDDFRDAQKPNPWLLVLELGAMASIARATPANPDRAKRHGSHFVSMP